jgi:predicted glutamine amidotransferase
MCELLGLSSNISSTLTLSLSKLAEHGGPPTSITDGWGVAYYEDFDVRLIKDCATVADSDWLRFLADHDVRSHIVISHIRKATMGERAYRNTQPFTRELAGRMHLFAHNGWLPGIVGCKSFSSLHYRPVGETDSERAFCELLGRMRALWTVPGDVPPLQARLSVIASFAKELRALGPANFLYSDGETLFAHGDRRKNGATGIFGPPGLVLLKRQCPLGGQGGVAHGLWIKNADQFLTLVASVPLTDERWEQLAEGQLVAIANGEVVPHGPTLA